MPTRSPDCPEIDEILNSIICPLVTDVEQVADRHVV